MDFTKVQVGNLIGKTNWQSWKYKVSVCLRGTPGAIDVVNGGLVKPTEPSPDASVADVQKYEQTLEKFSKADSVALIIMSTNMTEDTLQKVIRFNTAREVWQELHRLFDGSCEDKAYDLCEQFFSYKRESGDDISSHVSKIQNLWDQLKKEIKKDNNSPDLPELFLICKILGTLPDEYFAFKSSWMLMSKSERTIDNLIVQLCAYERALSNKEAGGSSSEALSLNKTSNKTYRLFCKYCKKKTHKIKDCEKWKADGKPPKSTKKENKSVNNLALMSVNLNLSEKQESSLGMFYIDNGCTNHVTFQRNLFKSFKDFTSPHTMVTANGECVNALGSGDIEVVSIVKDQKHILTLTDVWYIPSLKKNLFSPLAAQDKHENSLFTSNVNRCYLKINNEVVLEGSRNRLGGLYKIKFQFLNTKTEHLNSLSNTDLLQLYHERLAHQNKRHVKDWLSRELGVKVNTDSDVCEGCIFGKAHRQPFGTRTRAEKPGETVAADVCGPFDTPSISGYRYFVLFKDDYSRYRFVFFLKHKSEVVEKLKEMLSLAKTAGHKIKEILCDNGGEFDNAAVRKVLKYRGISQRFTMPYTPEQNGLCERENRTIVEAARAMFHAHGGFTQGLWAELVNTATYILNRSGTSSEKDKSPYEVWTGKKPSLKHLRVIGCQCYAHIPKQRRKKMEKKAVQGVLIGYDDFGYRIWVKEQSRLIRSKDVTFCEEPLLRTTSIKLEIGTQTEQESIKTEEISEEMPSESELESEQVKSDDQDDVASESEEVEEPQKSQQKDQTNQNSHPMTLRDRSTLKLPKKYEDYIMMACKSDSDEPSTYKEAIASEHEAEWRKAMEVEIKALDDNKTWRLEPLPKGKKAISCKWVYKVKTNPDGSIERFKARLVAKGFTQKKGVDYDQTFSPVAKAGTVRAVISMAASEKMTLSQFDVTSAFLYGELDEEIYMKQPEGFTDGTNKVCRLQRSLYGLKQAPRCWNKRFCDYLLKINFVRSGADPCMFIRKDELNTTIIVLYVDDGLVATTEPAEIQKVIEDLKKEFKITVKSASYYLGIELDCHADGAISVRQTAYTKKILARFGMDNCNSLSTPIVKENLEAGKVSDTEQQYTESEDSHKYRQAVGALMYLMVATRPDIAYAVGVVSRTLEHPSKSDWARVKRIFRYLKGTENFGITYKPNFKKGTLECYSDADHGGDESTGRSTTGVVCLYAGGAISWLSQRQTSVAISTTEAEVVAASEASREVVWLKRLLSEVVELKTPTLQVDNEAAIRLSQNPEYHRRTKHIRTRHFFVREMVTEGEININKVDTKYQLADILTKPLFKPRHLLLSQEIGLTHIIK